MDKQKQDLRRLDWEEVLLVLIFGFFLIQALFFAKYLGKGISPDENYHYSVSLAFSKVLGIPSNSVETFSCGDITRIPFLFFWINGRIINISNTLGFDGYLPIRLIGTIYSALSLLFIWLTSKAVIRRKYYRLLPVFMLATTMMFNFLAGAISYDNLVNLLSVISIWALIMFLKNDKKKSFYLFCLIISGLAIALVKFSGLPLVFIEIVIVIYTFIKNRSFNFTINKKWIPYYLVIGIFAIPNILLYGGNFLKYRSLTPSCNQVMTHEDCLNNAIYVRQFVYQDMETTSKGERRIRDLLLDDERMNPYDYIFVWEKTITPRLYGIFGHQSVVLPRNFEFAYTMLFVVLLIPLIRHIGKKKDIMSLLILMIFYSLILAYRVHYLSYLRTGSLNIAMQGRYLLPIISCAYIIESWSISKIKKDFFRKVILILLMIVFLMGNLLVLREILFVDSSILIL